MTAKRKVGRPKAEPSKVIRIRLPIPLHDKAVKRGGDIWAKRTLIEILESGEAIESIKGAK